MGASGGHVNNKLKYLSLVTLTVQNSAVALSMRYARTRPGNMFIASTAVVSAEFVKLLASLYLVFHDAGSLQVTYQMKILTTAMFAVLMLNKKLKASQWIALLLLTAGVALVQLSSTGTSSVAGQNQNKLLGCIAAISACCCSGFAGIYFEKILKGSDVSIWVRNVQLSFLSLPLGIMTSLTTDWTDITTKGFFFAFDAYVVYLVVLNAVGGLLVAMVVKYADNILKGFATSLAIVLSTIASMFLFNFVLTIQFFFGTLFVMASIFLYSYEPSKKLGAIGKYHTSEDERFCLK